MNVRPADLGPDRLQHDAEIRLHRRGVPALLAQANVAGGVASLLKRVIRIADRARRDDGRLSAFAHAGESKLAKDVALIAVEPR